jgi:hypothetical protein
VKKYRIQGRVTPTAIIKVKKPQNDCPLTQNDPEINNNEIGKKKEKPHRNQVMNRFNIFWK